MNTLKIEMNAVTKLKDCLNKCEFLNHDIKDNDKTPSWDGDILVYKDDSLKKDKLKGVLRIQVKGKYEVDLSKKEIKHDVNIFDLENYNSDGGVIYFVIYMKDYDNFKIYYNVLLSWDLAGILKEINEKNNKKTNKKKLQKNFRISFKEFPKNDTDLITDICMNFIENRNKQIGTSENAPRNIEELVEEKMGDNIFYFSVSTKNNNPTKYILNHPIYLYKKLPHDISMPVDKYSFNSIIEKGIEQTVYIGDFVICKKIDIEKTMDNKYILIGNSIKVDFNNKKINFSYNDNLDEYVLILEIFSRYIEGKVLKIGDFNLDLKECKIPNIENLLKLLPYLKSMQKVLETYGVNKTMDLSKFDSKSKLNMDILIETLVENIITFEEDVNFNPILILPIANLKIVVYNEKISNRKYLIKNMFTDDNDSFVLMDNDKTISIPCSKYTILKQKDFETLSNINYPLLVKDIISIPYCGLYGEWLTNLIIEMLRAYDNIKECRVLNSAEEITNWLCLQDKNDALKQINNLQCIKRKRKLNDSEKKILIDIKIDNMNDNYACLGVNILLEYYTECDYNYNNLNKNQQENFVKEPIYKLWNK